MRRQMNTFKQVVEACIPTILGYAGIGIAVGVVGKSVGLSIFEMGLMSTLVYAGSAQFIICGMFAIAAPISAIIFTTFLVNLHHFLMSMSIAPYFKKESLLTNVGIGSLLTDESYGVLTMNLTQHPSVQFTYGLNLTAYLSWILATITGSILEKWLPDPQVFGLDFTLVAMFIGLFVFQLDVTIKTTGYQILFLISIVAAVVYLLMSIFSAEVAVLLATLSGCMVGVMINDDK